MEIISIQGYEEKKWEKQKDHIRQVLEEELKKIHKTNRDEAEERLLHFITLVGDVLSMNPNWRQQREAIAAAQKEEIAKNNAF